MNRILLLSALSLVATAFIAPTAGAQAGDTCVEYAYVADYNWYYLCAGNSTSCKVYTKHVSGVSESRSCLVSTDAAALDLFPVCTFYTGDMDHMFRVCVDSNPKCAVYEEFQSGGKRCFP